jgi:hypothetical protein
MGLGYFFFKAFLVVFSGSASFLCLIFMLSPTTFSRIEDALGIEIGGTRIMVSVLEGKINFINDWCYKNHVLCGPVLAVLAAWNTRSAFFL